MARRETAEVWAARIAEYRASGEQMTTWCERHQIARKQLYRWMHRLGQIGRSAPSAGAVKAQWLPVQLDETVPASAAPMLVRIGSASIEVRAGFDPSLLADVVRVLKSLC